MVDDFCSLCSSPTSDARDACDTPSCRRYIASFGSMTASLSDSSCLEDDSLKEKLMRGE